ncbi:MAG: XrtA/PEP-CTERM system histidine kinase PrsK [Woeseia sp.]
MLVNLSAFGYALAGFAFLILSVLLVTSWQGRLPGAMLTIAAVISTLWGFTLAFSVADPALAVMKVFLAETLRNGSWLVFLSVLFAGGTGGATEHRLLAYGGPALASVVLLSGIGLFAAERAGLASPGVGTALVSGSLALSLFALIMVEQIYRNARASQRNGLKYIGLGLIGMFGYDLVLYTHWILFGRIDELLWSVRGTVATLCVPLIAVSAQRNPNWSVGIFVSRHVVFYTTTLMGAGLYLILMAGVGYYIRVFGGEWGPAAQLIFFVAAILILALLLFSERLRARLRVFLSKHFFRNHYDYREEWLRLMGTLSSPREAGLSLSKRAIKALSDILGAPQGLLFIRERGEGPFRCEAGWNTGVSEQRIAPDSSLVRFLNGTGWIVDAEEYRLLPERYEGLDTDLGQLGLDRPGFVVPLVTDERLVGFVLLARPRMAHRLNFEDHDLLKTAGRQIASYLDQEQKKWELAESRQFETFNRLTAYLMHDLKNLIAQQSLVVENSQKHKDKPEFVDDAIATVKSGVARMRKVLEQLAQGAPVHNVKKIELGKLLLEAASQCADRRPEPRVDVGDARLWVRADRERLLMALVHAIRNAQDATPPQGSVTVGLESCGTDCLITVSDTGRGMDRSFIEERLFKPFDSTKGTQGMGIGAHQIRETVRALGGQMQVDSSPGSGTRISLRLPLETNVQAA